MLLKLGFQGADSDFMNKSVYGIRLWSSETSKGTFYIRVKISRLYIELYSNEFRFGVRIFLSEKEVIDNDPIQRAIRKLERASGHAS